MLKKYIEPIFDPARSICAVVCSPGEIDEMENSLRAIGYDMERREIDLGADEEEGDDDEESEEGDSGEDDSDEAAISETDSGQSASKKVKL